MSASIDLKSAKLFVIKDGERLGWDNHPKKNHNISIFCWNSVNFVKPLLTYLVTATLINNLTINDIALLNEYLNTLFTKFLN